MIRSGLPSMQSMFRHRWLEGTLSDVSWAVRSLRRSRAFSIVAIVMLGLSIGAGTTVYSVVDTVVLRPLPFSDPDRLVAVLGVDAPSTSRPGNVWTTPPTYLGWRRTQHAFSAIALAGRTSLRLQTNAGEPADALAAQVTWEFFQVLRVAPRLGRALTAADEEPGNDHVVVLSDRFWRRYFNGDTSVVGRRLRLNEQAYEIVGVMPPAFEYPVADINPTELFVPVLFQASDYARSSGHSYNYVVIGRLNDGVDVKWADGDMKGVTKALDAEFPRWEPGRSARVLRLQDYLVGNSRQWLLLLFGAVCFVLLIACANVANLMLVRMSARRPEFAVRLALGASRSRLVRAILMEGVLLSLAAAVTGVCLAYYGVSALKAWLPSAMPRIAAIAINGRVLAMEVSAAILIGVAFAIAPAFQSASGALVDTLKSGGRGFSDRALGARLRAGLVVFEIAVAMALLVGSGLFLMSFRNLMAIDLGFDSHNVIVLNNVGLRFDPSGLEASPWSWNESESEGIRNQRAASYFSELMSALGRVPGVAGAAVSDGGLPIEGSQSFRTVTLPGAGDLRGPHDLVDRFIVSPSYFSVFHLPVVRGRVFSDEDGRGAPMVAVINEVAARKYWPDQDALGQHLKIEGIDREVIGIVGDVRHLGPENPVPQQMYVPLAQAGTTMVHLAVRTTTDPSRLLPTVKAAIWSVNPDQHLTERMYSLDAYLDQMTRQRRLNMAILTFFGLVGLAIAAAGVFGVMAYAVSQRTNELGVRMCLGASPARIIWMVLRHAMVLVSGGIVLGAAAAWYCSRLAESFLFQVRPDDTKTFGVAVAVLAATGLIAALLPAIRAARVDPATTLRAGG